VNANHFVKLVLQSPFHALLGNTMLITVTGRRTGRPITTPVNYFREGDTLWIISKRSRNWWRNITSCPEVELRLGGKDIPATAALVLDDESVAAGVRAYVRALPISSRALGIRMENGAPNPVDLERAAIERLLVRVCLPSTKD
jgi:deazaflavin-dependent oxidoreductase (nitroreductase family)